MQIEATFYIEGAPFTHRVKAEKLLTPMPGTEGNIFEAVNGTGAQKKIVAVFNNPTVITISEEESK